MAINIGAGVVSNIQNWGEQDALAIAMALSALLGLFVKTRWAQVAAPLAFSLLEVGYLVAFYPALVRG